MTLRCYETISSFCDIRKLCAFGATKRHLHDLHEADGVHAPECMQHGKGSLSAQPTIDKCDQMYSREPSVQVELCAAVVRSIWYMQPHRTEGTAHLQQVLGQSGGLAQTQATQGSEPPLARSGHSHTGHNHNQIKDTGRAGACLGNGRSSGTEEHVPCSPGKNAKTFKGLAIDCMTKLGPCEGLLGLTHGARGPS